MSDFTPDQPVPRKRRRITIDDVTWDEDDTPPEPVSESVSELPEPCVSALPENSAEESAEESAKTAIPVPLSEGSAEESQEPALLIPTVEEEPPLLYVENLNVVFNDNPVLRNINLTLRRGETVAIIGESGCGKTVFLKSLIGLIDRNRLSGRVLIEGRDFYAMSSSQQARERIRFGFVFQQAALFDSMSIEENVAFPLEQHSGLAYDAIRETVIRLLVEVGLPPSVLEKYPAELSGGMRKRVGFARALAMGPEMMLYDEPTTGLDPIMSDVINELIINTRNRHKVSGLMVTHDMKSAQKVADRIVMFYPLARLGSEETQIIFDGTPEEIELCRDPRVAQFIRGEARERLMELTESYKPQYPE